MSIKETKTEYAILGYTAEGGWENFKPFGFDLPTMEYAEMILSRWQKKKAEEPFPGALRTFEDFKIVKRTIIIGEWEDA